MRLHQHNRSFQIDFVTVLFNSSTSRFGNDCFKKRRENYNVLKTYCITDTASYLIFRQILTILLIIHEMHLRSAPQNQTVIKKWVLGLYKRCTIIYTITARKQ